MEYDGSTATGTPLRMTESELCALSEFSRSPDSREREREARRAAVTEISSKLPYLVNHRKALMSRIDIAPTRPIRVLRHLRDGRVVGFVRPELSAAGWNAIPASGHAGVDQCGRGGPVRKRPGNDVSAPVQHSLLALRPDEFHFSDSSAVSRRLQRAQ